MSKPKKVREPERREDGANINCSCGADVCEKCPPYGRVYTTVVQITAALPIGETAQYATRPTLFGLTTEGGPVFWNWRDNCWMGLEHYT